MRMNEKNSTRGAASSFDKAQSEAEHDLDPRQAILEIGVHVV